jgi:hypothetical protein
MSKTNALNFCSYPSSHCSLALVKKSCEEKGSGKSRKAEFERSDFQPVEMLSLRTVIRYIVFQWQGTEMSSE